MRTGGLMDFLEFKKGVYRQFGLNLEGYKEKQLKRRIDSLMQSQQYEDYGKYLNSLARNEDNCCAFWIRL